MGVRCEGVSSPFVPPPLRIRTSTLRARGRAHGAGGPPRGALAGGGRLVALRYRDGSGAAREIACDGIATGYGLTPDTRLADLAGCEFHYQPTARQWLPVSDDDGRATAANQTQTWTGSSGRMGLLASGRRQSEAVGRACWKYA